MKATTDSTATKSAADLRKAYNAALARIIESGEYLDIKNRTQMKEVIACITCAPDSTQTNYPAKDKVTGRLKDILDKKLVKIAGLYYNDMPAGDYTVKPPVGFWPEYARAIFKRIGDYYGVEIAIEWVLFTQSNDIMTSVRSGESDLTDLYMILSSFYNGKDRIEAFSVSCSPGGYESTISVAKSSNVESMLELNNLIDQGNNVKVGALSAADFNSVKPFFSAKAQPVTFESVKIMREKLLSGEIIAGVTSTNPGDTDEIITFRSGVVSPRASMFLADIDALEDQNESKQLPTITWIIILVVCIVVVLIVGIFVGRCTKKTRAAKLPTVSS